MSNIWITSDTHYFHANIAGPSVSSWCSGFRDYDSVEDMNDAIVESFNSMVKSNDLIYHLGDWSFGGKDKVQQFMDRLDCKNVILIYGNHDHNIKKHFKHLFLETHELLHRKIAGKFFVLCHYAMRIWMYSHKGSLHCYGHSHHSLPGIGRSMDVGWCKYRRPLHIEEVVEKLGQEPITFVDHHNEGTN